MGILLSISTSILIALYIQYLSELTLKQYLLVAIPVFIFGLYHYIFASAYVNWMIVPLFLIIVLIFVVWKTMVISTLYTNSYCITILCTTNYNDTRFTSPYY